MLRQVSIVVGLILAVATAVFIGMQMSSEAMAVVVGVVCGVVASIPTSFLLLLFLSRWEKQREADSQRVHAGGFPPVVVIQGGGPSHLSPWTPMGYSTFLGPYAAPHREFHMVGEDALLSDGQSHGGE
ncbi:MAG: hypothetical protein ACUVWZ_00905 [Anaerolineae bacterium]